MRVRLQLLGVGVEFVLELGQARGSGVSDEGWRRGRPRILLTERFSRSRADRWPSSLSFSDWAATNDATRVSRS